MTDTELWIRGMALALRDMCEQQGFITVSGTFEGGASITYTVTKGALVLAAGHRLEITEDALDVVGLVPA